MLVREQPIWATCGRILDTTSSAHPYHVNCFLQVGTRTLKWLVDLDMAISASQSTALAPPQGIVDSRNAPLSTSGGRRGERHRYPFKDTLTGKLELPGGDIDNSMFRRILKKYIDSQKDEFKITLAWP